MMHVTPALLISETRMNASSCRTGERPADGSSSSSTFGSIMSARLIATIWRSPPESDPARCFSRLPSSAKIPVTNSSRSA